MAFGLGQGQAQIGVACFDDFHVFVLEGFEVARAYEAVDHETHRPSQIGWHASIAVEQFVAFAQCVFVQWVLLPA